MKERTRTRKRSKAKKETKGEEEGTKAGKGRGKGGTEKGQQAEWKRQEGTKEHQNLVEEGWKEGYCGGEVQLREEEIKD